jgi:hypothetical protein
MLKSANLTITSEQIAFDTRIAIEVMGWKKLDDSLRYDFEAHKLQVGVYPFFETFNSQGFLVYHPTPYHSQVFSPSLNPEDDIASLIVLLGRQPNDLHGVLSMLHFIHHQRALTEAGFVPSDEYYRVARYYKTGDFATSALHLVERSEHINNKEAAKATSDLGKKYLGKNGIKSISFNDGVLKIKCRDTAAINSTVRDDFNKTGYKVEFEESSI